MRRTFAIALTLILLVQGLLVPQPLTAAPAAPTANALRISQVYGGGGGTGAAFTNDFVELFNQGASTVNLSTYSLQYTSAAGTSWGNQKLNLSGSIAPGQYFLVQLAGGATGSALPTPDATGTFNMSGSSAKLALVGSQMALPAETCPNFAANNILDFVGYGTSANCFEAAAAPAPSAATAILRVGGGCTDTDNNAADFAAGAPAPRNTASALYVCPSSTNPSGAGAAAPNAVFPGEITLLTVTVTPGANPTSTGLAVSADLSSIGGANPQTFYDNGLNGDVTAGDSVFSFGATVSAATVPGAKTLPVTITDAEMRTGSTSIALTVKAPPVAIHTVQGAGHISPLNNQTVTLLPAVVTALRTTGGTRGFYLQDPAPDADPATSEGIFVFTGGSSNPASLVAVGDLVQVDGKVSEYRAAPVGLTLTELVAPYTISPISSGNLLPAPTVLGTGGLIPPATVIEDDATGSVETIGVFDPASDGIDFYESLEGMLVQVNDAVAVGPRSNFTTNREIPVVGDNGANAVVRTNRGGVVAQATDYNPERIILNDWISGGPTLPVANVGDAFPGATVGVLDYSFNNFKLQVITLPALVSGGLAQEVGPEAGLYQLSAAAFNVENLAPGDPAEKFSALASLIINNMKSPDILSIEEIQDSNGATNDAVVEASQTWSALIAAIQAAGGPTYEYRQVDPVDDQDGGAPGGNIRVGFLFRTDRGLAFVDRPGATSTTANAVIGAGPGTQLQYSPGRIDPTNVAFTESRKPLAGEFTFAGRRLFVIANHWNSKGGDQPLFGVNQPPVFSSELQRNQQAAVVHGFVNAILTADPNANVLVMGDLNDFQFSSALATLKGTPPILTDLIETLPLAERYTYVYEGNSETLDHILASDALMARPFVYDVVHVNSEFAAQISDHEPQVLVVTLNLPPTANAGGPYTVVEGQQIILSGSGSDPDGDPLTYAWDLDNDGVFETPGQSVTFTAPSGPAELLVGLQVCDDQGACTTTTATISVSNVPPVVSNNRPKQAALYFKPIFPVIVQATDITADMEHATVTTSWSANGGPLQGGLPPDLALEPGGCTPSGTATTCTWMLSGTMAVPPGVYTVRVTVTDPDGGSASTDITIVVIVIDPNYPPTAEAGGPYTVAEGHQITLTGTGDDPDGDVMTYYWDLDNDGSYETVGQDVAFYGDDGPATRTVVLQVCDDRGECGVDTATITITNVPPLVTNNLPEQEVRRYHPVQAVTISAVDVPGDIPLGVATEWTKDGGAVNSGLPAGVTLTAGSCTPSSPLTTCTWLLGGVAQMERGEYLITLRFDDHDGGIGSTIVKIIVPNEPPVANAGGPYTVAEGQQIALQGSGTDPEADPLTYAWDLDNNGTFETAGQNPMFSALNIDGPATRTVGLQVCDDWDACDDAVATIVITNVAPVVSNDRPSQTVPYGHPVAVVTVTYSDVTPDMPLAVATTWTLNGGAAQTGLPAGLTLTAPVCTPGASGTTCTQSTGVGSKLAVGTYVVKVTVSDDDGGVASTEFAITVEVAKLFLPWIGR